MHQRRVRRVLPYVISTALAVSPVGRQFGTLTGIWRPAYTVSGNLNCWSKLVEEASQQALVEKLIKLIDHLAVSIRATAGDTWLNLDLTVPQIRTLARLRQGPARMSDIAARLGCSLSSATSMVERLEGKGLVQRVHDPDDRRVVICRLTPEGREQFEQVWRVQRNEIERLVGSLSIDQLTIIIQAMTILTETLERDGKLIEPAAEEAPVNCPDIDGISHG